MNGGYVQRMEPQYIFQPRTLHHWINPIYLDISRLQKLRSKFPPQKPFPYLEFRNFFQPEKIIAVVKALAQEQFHPQQADLFQFKQTGDLSAAKNQVLQEFRMFLSSPEFISYLGNIASTKLKPNSIDMSGTLYEDTDYLLCHDDQLEGRKIAYFLYLSELNPNDGGALNLFASENGIPTEVAATIIPRLNTFSFFMVSKNSFHEVAEVVRDVQRIAISGWFHDQ